jgi:hypothetical protein
MIPKKPSFRLVGAFVSMAGLLVGLDGRAEDRPSLKISIEAGIEGDETTAKVYLQANEAFVKKTLPEAVRACATDPKRPVTPFELIVTVTKGGKIASVTADPMNPFTLCVSKELGSKTLTAPPHDPTDVYVEVTIDR